MYHWSLREEEKGSAAERVFEEIMSETSQIWEKTQTYRSKQLSEPKQYNPKEIRFRIHQKSTFKRKK